MTRGRRPDLSIEPSRQLQTQRAFRERKAAYLRGLEEEVQQQQDTIEQLRRRLGESGPVDGGADGEAGSSTAATSPTKKIKAGVKRDAIDAGRNSSRPSSPTPSLSNGLKRSRSVKTESGEYDGEGSTQCTNCLRLQAEHASMSHTLSIVRAQMDGVRAAMLTLSGAVDKCSPPLMGSSETSHISSPAASSSTSNHIRQGSRSFDGEYGSMTPAERVVPFHAPSGLNGFPDQEHRFSAAPSRSSPGISRAPHLHPISSIAQVRSPPIASIAQTRSSPVTSITPVKSPHDAAFAGGPPDHYRQHAPSIPLALSGYRQSHSNSPLPSGGFQSGPPSSSNHAGPSHSRPSPQHLPPSFRASPLATSISKGDPPSSALPSRPPPHSTEGHISRELPVLPHVVPSGHSPPAYVSSPSGSTFPTSLQVPSRPGMVFDARRALVEGPSCPVPPTRVRPLNLLRAGSPTSSQLHKPPPPSAMASQTSSCRTEDNGATSASSRGCCPSSAPSRSDLVPATTASKDRPPPAMTTGQGQKEQPQQSRHPRASATDGNGSKAALAGQQADGSLTSLPEVDQCCLGIFECDSQGRIMV